jgi:lipopolysaccharide biosynthesis glycosyltransferase
LIVKGDIAKLWEFDVSQYFIAAVEDVGMENTGDFGAVVKRNIGIPRKIKYFNAGVLIINLEKWRTGDVSEKLRNYLLENKEKIIFADQDGLNAIFMEQWLPLPMEWNLQSGIFELLEKNRITRKDMMDAILNPMIIHYTEKSKPWHPTDVHPLRHEYTKYALLTPWKDFRANSNIKDKFIRIIKKTFVGKALIYYQRRINDYYIIDKTFLSDKLSSSDKFKLMYSLFFPFIFIYFRLFSRIALYSYFIENKKSNSNISGVFYKLLFLIA